MSPESVSAAATALCPADISDDETVMLTPAKLLPWLQMIGRQLCHSHQRRVLRDIEFKLKDIPSKGSNIVPNCTKR
ncbi:hypothetical protein NXC24_PA00171 (plasmid) [Rhizobium sp. NXC24]|nr:hypothetical protein NXC24_PA00171 [Rhizobium sp. NXC24]